MLLKLLSLPFLLAYVTLSTEGCVEQGAPISAVGEPHFVPQSQPDSVQETGIGQDPGSGGVCLQWHRVPSTSGYKVYRSDTTDALGRPKMFSIVAEISSSSGLSDTSVVDSAVTGGIRYYYYVTAYITGGSSSAPSDTIDYELLPRAKTYYPGPNAVVDPTSLNFRWVDLAGGGYTVIRVKDITVTPAKVVWITPRFIIYGGSTSSAVFNFDSTATSNLLSGHSYQWRVDRFNVDGTGRPFEGSRSVWWTFTVK